MPYHGHITRSKAKKIQQTFILHLQNWIGSVQPSFLKLETDTIDEGQLNFEEGEDDKNHGVPTVRTRPITRSKAKKIQQTFILHLQNWIGSVQPSFLKLEADTIDE